MPFDVVIVGGGPIGIAEACLLKCFNPKLNICVLEGRAQTTRDYGLRVGSDAIKELRRTAKKAQGIEREILKKMDALFSKWSRNSFVRINEIQAQLAGEAEKAHVTIFKGEGYRLTQEKMHALFTEGSDSTCLSPELLALKEQLSHVKVIVGADGAHSTVRQCVMGSDKDNLTDVKKYSYVLEVKHEVAAPTTLKNARLKTKMAASDAGEILFENVGKPNGTDGLRPVTDLLFVDKEVHRAFQEKNHRNEVTKGSPGKAWSLNELKAKARGNATVASFLSKIERMMDRTRKIWGHDESVQSKEPKITTFPLKVYRSKKLLATFKDKKVVLIGDASSGLVLQRGLNKGFVEAIRSAQAISKDLREQNESFTALANYQKMAASLYKKETRAIRRKFTILNLLKLPLRKIIAPLFRWLEFRLSKNSALS